MRGPSDLVRAAVIGVGHLGKWHAQKYNSLSSAQLVGVCDINKERAESLAQELDTSAITNYKELVGQVDAVTIASTTTTHYELSKFFLENDIHVLVEKPMTSTVEEGQELCALAEQKGLKFQVGHVERFNPALMEARKKLQRPLFIECHRLAPFKPRGVDVSVILDLMIHDLDVILSLVQSEPTSVSAIGTPVLTKTIDIANARVEFASGTVANITASRVSQNTQRKFRVFQEDQYLSIDFGTGEVNLLTKTGDWQDGEIPLEAEAWSLDKGDALLAETASFVQSIVNDRPCEVSGRDGLVALQLAEQITEDIQRRLAR